MTDARTTRFATLGLFFGVSVWGLYWLPLRVLSDMGLSGGWGVVYFNFCPLLVLAPILIWGRHNQQSPIKPFQGFPSDFAHRLPRSKLFDDLSFEAVYDANGQRIVVGVIDGSDLEIVKSLPRATPFRVQY